MQSPHKNVSPLSIFNDTNTQNTVPAGSQKQIQAFSTSKRLAQASPVGSRDRRKRVLQEFTLDRVTSPQRNRPRSQLNANQIPNLSSGSESQLSRPSSAPCSAAWSVPGPGLGRAASDAGPAYNTDAAIEHLLGHAAISHGREIAELEEVIEFANLERYFDA